LIVSLFFIVCFLKTVTGAILTVLITFVLIVRKKMGGEEGVTVDTRSLDEHFANKSKPLSEYLE
jgi:hypothetical protein